MIRQLAEYENLQDEVSFSEPDLGKLLFGDAPVASVLIGEIDDQVEGFALYSPKLSTFKGRLVLYLEDLFVRENARGKGLGTSLLREVALQAAKGGYPRVEWAVLDWNEPAVRFYRALGANIDADWRIVQLAGDALEVFGQSDR